MAFSFICFISLFKKSHCGLSPRVILHEWVTVLVYIDILSDDLHPMVQTLFPDRRPVHQDDNYPVHTAGIVREGYKEHNDQLQHFVWPPQFPNLNIMESSCGILEGRLPIGFQL